MKARVHDCCTDLYLTGDEAKELCRIGQGADTCIWLLVSGEGFECAYYNKPIPLLERWRAGLTVAKRDGCEQVKALTFTGKAGFIDLGAVADRKGGKDG